MLPNLGIGNIMDSLVPISRFNKGEANKIFEEVRKTGCKVVVKNNVPACVLLTPEKFREIVDALEDDYLLKLAETRLANDSGVYHSTGDVLAELGITKEELDAFGEAEIEIG